MGFRESRMGVVQNSTTVLVVEEHKQRPTYGTQYLAAFSASMGAMAVGSVIGYSAPASAAFRWQNSTDNATSEGFYLGKEERSWFAGTMSIGALLGCMVAGYTIKTIGRKGTMLLSVIPLIIGWALIGLAQNLAMLLCGRILCGLCTGTTSLTVPTYTTEYASKDIRGTLGSGFQLFITLGVLYAYVLGTVVESWRWLSVVCGALGLVYLLLAVFLRESPIYLLTKGEEEQARQSLQYFRGKSYDIEKELQELKDSLRESSDARLSLKDLSSPCVLKPLLTILLLMFFQQLSGINAVVFNINAIFQDSGSSISEDASIIIIGAVQVLSTVASTFLIDRAGRKLLLSLSAGVMAISITCMGVFFYEKEQDEEWVVSTLGWLPLTSLMVFCISFCLGYGSVPWVMMGELFHPSVKAAASSMAATFNWTCVFIVTFTFESLQEAIHVYGAFWFFGGICMINFIFCLTIVPETKGRTLQEITASFDSPVAKAVR
ncbi:facilitated trehalose transporter Tret1-like [Panulirus ornatus]|uniref:facilitated trehalose transporter Tret1-like n=1 Tax=Panulirus ornatus TaxID=150431 RepID=UPI003A89EDF6